MRRAALAAGLVVAITAVGLAGRTHPLTRANKRAGLRISKRAALYEDPGVVAIVGRRASEVRRVWFGDVESTAVAPSAIGGVSAAVPPGPADRSVVVRVRFEDGTDRNAGRFRYGTHLTFRNRLGGVGHGRGCSAPGPNGREKDYDAGTLSRVKRVGRDRFLYTYRVRNRTADDVTISWSALQFLGLPGGLTVDLPAGDEFRVTRESSSPPVLVFGTASSSAMPGCLPDGNTVGDRWSGEALLPADALPHVPPPENVRVAPRESEHTATVEWTVPINADVDQIVITRHEVHPWRDLFDHGRRWRNHVVHSNEREWLPATATTYEARHLETGVTVFAVRTIKDGVRSAPVHVHVVR